MKNKICFIITFVFLFIFLFESFPNEKVYAAQEISSNQWISGSLDHKSVTYVYKMEKSGYFYLKGITTDTTYYNVTADISVNYKKLERVNLLKNSGGESFKYAFKKGTKIKITINSRSDASYKFKIVFKKVKNFEKENNNSRKKATHIKAGKKRIGLTDPSEKYDWFVFKAPSKGKYKISTVVYKGEEIHSKVYKGYELLDSYITREGKGWEKYYYGDLEKGDKIYIRIVGDWYYNIINQYKIKVKKID